MNTKCANWFVSNIYWVDDVTGLNCKMKHHSVSTPGARSIMLTTSVPLAAFRSLFREVANVSLKSKMFIILSIFSEIIIFDSEDGNSDKSKI